ncbi:uncharacterized protein LOC134947727 [Pseudophryne corroboree]|uniref:uncharacterized protein LOC134947727 n=1 Tax=Pseudophryne corroboree TaxID=495146 RepID=UPI0030813653
MHCVKCKGLFSRKHLWRHVKRCLLRKSDSPKPGRTRVQGLFTYATPLPKDVGTGLWKLLSEMNYDDVVPVIKGDRCIMQFGQHLYNRLGSDVSKHDYIRQKLREVGRLLLKAMKVTPLRCMEDFICPPNFLQVVHAVRSLAGYDDRTNTYKIPSLALKVGHSLQKISAMVECQALMEGSALTVERARNFRKIYEARWSELISTAALKALREIKWNAQLLLPFTDDVKHLNLYLLDRQREYIDELSAHPSKKQWSMLAKVTLTQLILFNRRREGEVSKMRLSSFDLRHTADLQGDVAQALSELEKALCRHFSRIEILGKRGRKVPVLLSPSMQKAMELLTEKRTECGVTPH